jgi:hypothetical protein
MRFEKICAVPVLFGFVVRQNGLRLVGDPTGLINVSALCTQQHRRNIFRKAPCPIKSWLNDSSSSPVHEAPFTHQNWW